MPDESLAPAVASVVARRVVVGVATLLSTGWSSGSLNAEDWPQFLGPQRNGVSSEVNLIDRWPENGVKIAFRVPGGEGMSGISILGETLVTLAHRDDRQVALALDAKTGKERWVTDLGEYYKNPMGNGPRAAPTLVMDRAFVFTGDGILLALDLNDGRVIWRTNVLKQLRGKEADYGMSCSPLVAGSNVVVTAGCPDATVVAYDVNSGRQSWAVGNDRTGYSSPALLTIDGESQIAVFSGSALLGIQPKTGKQLWRYPFETDYDCNIVTPRMVDGNVFISSGENHGSVLLKISRKATGYEVDEVWSSFGRESVLRNEWQTSVVLDGYLYGFDNVGSAGPITHLTCIKADTGEKVWQKNRFGKGNLIQAEEKLLISTMDGELVMVKATPEDFSELGREKLLGMTRQAPALANGRVYLRDNREIICIDVRKP